MKSINGLLGAMTLVLAGAASAADDWYLGVTAGYYDLDGERAISEDHNSVTAGVQVGKYLSDTLAVELGYGANAGHDDFDVLSLNGLLWLNNSDASHWRPYVLFGLNQYDFQDASNLVLEHDDRSTQIMMGVGMGTRFSHGLEFRADLRGMLGHDEDGEDMGVQFSLNKVFGSKSVAPAPAPAAAPVVAQAIPEPEVEAEPEPEPEVRTITVRLNVEFEVNKDTVLAVYGDQLEAIAAAMKAHDDIDLVLEGHSDSRGADQYNLSLSDRRAKAVKAKLVEVYGIPAARISAVGYGETKPIASNETEEGRARNRRVVGEMSFSEVYNF
ncbi:OmpA family protein [SAR92 clade bacterium H455]|uniref:OmpA family protein n=1 Tax=SAR92 clade bacterium H455 TaxID=2974818 RepID=A0ABY5TRF9_9GAMM|nr:OmpA family protein [SAR92 clade bacterium H455]